MFYKIGGKTIQVKSEERTRAYLILLEELSLYEKPEETSAVDLVIHYTETGLAFEEYSRNPSNHIELSDGYISILLHSDIAFRSINGQPTLYFNYKGNRPNWLAKLKGMQFTHPYEEVGQIFHEAVLIPAFLHFFSESLCLIHGSSLIDKNGNGIIFGGTGGVGKTTTELELVINRGYRFLADDISILDAESNVHPNFNFPKIYGYNILSKPEIYPHLFKSKGFRDRLWWTIQSKVKSENKIRRRANLNDFYGDKLGTKAPLKKIYILYRSLCKEISLKDLAIETLCEMNQEVIKTEFPSFYNHMAWHKYNRIRFGHPQFNYASVLSSLAVVQKNAIDKNSVKCFLVDIPLSYDAKQLSKVLPDILGL